MTALLLRTILLWCSVAGPVVVTLGAMAGGLGSMVTGVRLSISGARARSVTMVRIIAVAGWSAAVIISAVVA